MPEVRVAAFENGRDEPVEEHAGNNNQNYELYIDYKPLV